MLLRGLPISTALLVFAAIEPAIASDTDLVRYAITQGGLLAVVIVLLWNYRRDAMRQLSSKDEQLAVMIELVKLSTTALTRSSDACDRMARAAENLERRDR